MEKSGSRTHASPVLQAGHRGKRGSFKSFVNRMARRIVSSSSYFTPDSSASPHGKRVHSNEQPPAGGKIGFSHQPASARTKEASCFQGKQTKSQKNTAPFLATKIRYFPPLSIMGVSSHHKTLLFRYLNAARQQRYWPAAQNGRVRRVSTWINHSEGEV